MEALCLFFAKSILVSGLLLLCYLVVLRGKRLHQYNRFFLLSIFPASLVIPLLRLRLFPVPPAFRSHLSPVLLFPPAAGEGSISTTLIPQSQQAYIHWQFIPVALAALISGTLLLVLWLRIRKVRSMRRQHPVTRLEGIRLIWTDSPRAPFAFLKNLFWNKAIPFEGETGQLIFRHELAHIKQGHTYDNLVCQVLTCILWFNPFYWLVQKELAIVHEFIADEHAVADRDTGTFARMLLQSYYKGSLMVPEHHFFSSAVKRRLTMLQTATQPSYAVWRKFTVLPFIAGIVLSFSFTADSGQIKRSGPAEKQIVVLLDLGNRDQNVNSKAHGYGYTPKELCLKSALRIKELAPTYNVAIQFIKDRDKVLADKENPDVFLTLYLSNAPGKEQTKGDFNIYVSGESPYAKASNTYSSAILDAMALNGIIPGIEKTCGHGGVPCHCNVPATQLSMQHGDQPGGLSITKESLRLLNQAQIPALLMVLGNIKSKEGVQQLTDDSRLDALCHAILTGIVRGAAEKKNLIPAPIGPINNIANLWMPSAAGAEGCEPK